MSTALEVIETGEVIEQMTVEEASSITTQITVKLDAIADNYQAVMPLIRSALTRQAHVALGYISAGAYLSDRFGAALGRLGVDTRREVVKELSAAGLSTRAIAPVVGVTDRQVRRDVHSGGTYVPPVEVDDDDPALTQAECETLDESEMTDAELARQAEQMEAESRPVITGLDGKTYKPTAPRKPNRKPITDAFWTATYDLGKKVVTLTNLAADDRFNSNADQIRERNLQDLIRARDGLQSVIDQLTN